MSGMTVCIVLQSTKLLSQLLFTHTDNYTTGWWGLTSTATQSEKWMGILNFQSDCNTLFFHVTMNIIHIMQNLSNLNKPLATINVSGSKSLITKLQAKSVVRVVV